MRAAVILYCVGCVGASNSTARKTKHPSCLNSAGEAVDWFVALKKPNGAVTMESFGGVLTESASGMDGTSGNLIVNTVKQIYGMKAGSAVGVAVYNDDTDAGAQNSGKAHSKGVIGFDTTQGFWLVHSLPRYPNTRKSGYGPLPTVTYGQSFLCITLPTSAFEDIGKQLQVTGPQFYDTELSATLTTKLPSFAAALAGTTSKSVPTSALTMHTLGGAVFYHLAKSKSWGKDLVRRALIRVALSLSLAPRCAAAAPVRDGLTQCLSRSSSLSLLLLVLLQSIASPFALSTTLRSHFRPPFRLSSLILVTPGDVHEPNSTRTSLHPSTVTSSSRRG